MAAAARSAPVVPVERHNEILRTAHERIDEHLEARLAAIIQPILEQAGARAASRFTRLATNHLTASILRQADRDALGRIPPGDAGGFFGFRLRPLTLTAAAPEPTATMICLKPRPEEAAEIAFPRGEAAADLHVTLAYLGEADGDLGAVRDALAAVAASHAPLEGVVGGVGKFQPPGVAILLPDVPGLVELRVAVTEALASDGIDYGREHGFEAHISIDAQPDPDTLEETLARTAQKPLHFDALLLVRGDRVEAEIPLVGPPPVTAAGRVLVAASQPPNNPPQWSAPAGDELIDVEALVKTLRTKTDPVRQAVVQAGMTPALAAAGLDYDVTNPLTAKVLSQSGSQIVGIAETTRLNVMRVISRAYDQGLSIPDTAKAIRAGMSSASGWRAKMIARCLPGETPIDAGVVRAVTRRWYEGDFVIVRTESGREFSATPNHPMLTRRGWVRLGELDERDHLICRSGQQDTRSACDEDIGDPPATIAEVFKAAATVGIVERRTGGEPDFHGDGLDGEVDIARPFRPLTVGHMTTLYEHLREEIFAPSDEGPGATFCSECGHILSVDQTRCLCGIPSPDSSLGKDAARDSVGDAEAASEGLYRFSGVEGGDDSVFADVFAEVRSATATIEEVPPRAAEGSRFDASGSEAVTDRGFVDPKEFADLPCAQAAEIETDRIVSTRRTWFGGWVYNLVTPNGYFIANGGYTGNTELAGAANGGSLAATQLVSRVTGQGYYKQWLCVAPWTRVAGAGVLAVVRKPYEGELVTITARPAGRLGDAAPALRSFTVTPDHLVLTRRGWLPAGLVDEGDEAVGGIFAEHDAAGQPYVDDVQPTIAQVFDTASERLSAVGMMSVPVYLDGGRLGEKVDVVAANGCLRSDLDSTLSEPLRELALTLSDVGFDELLRASASPDGFIGHRRPEAGSIPEPSPRQQSGGVTMVAERVCLSLRAEGDSPVAEDTSDRGFADSQPPRERLQRLAGLVRFDQVVSIQRREWTGHVYDLTTLSGWFFADGYVAHNTAPGAPHPRHEDYDGLDGQTVALDEPFDVGGSQLQFPGDPDGDPGETINCRQRCALSYTDEPPEEGADLGAPSGGLDDAGASTDGQQALDDVMPLTPPPGDTVSVATGPFVPPDVLAQIEKNGLDLPLDQIKPTSEAGREVFAKAPTTQGIFKTGGHYMPDGSYKGGTWTEERERVHQDIVAKHFEGRVPPPEGEKPTAVFTAGGGASGKGGTIIDIGDRSFPLSDLEKDADRMGSGPEHDKLVAKGDEWAIRHEAKYPDVILMNPDIIKEMLPEYGRLRDAHDLYAAAGVHEESSEIGKVVANIAQERGFNVVMDTTGSSSEFLTKLEQATKDGYDVKVRMTSIPTNDAIVRSIDRGNKNGRYVALQALKKGHAGASKQLALWKDSSSITDWKVYDNAGRDELGRPMERALVAEGKGGEVTIYDQAKWDQILAKAKEGTHIPGATISEKTAPSPTQ